MASGHLGAPQQQAEQMAAPTSPASTFKKSLAKWESSTDGQGDTFYQLDGPDGIDEAFGIEWFQFGFGAGAEIISVNDILNNPAQPDLIAQGLSVSDATPTAGDTITVDVTATNQGAAAAGASTTYFYLSTDAVIDATDTLLGTAATGALAAGASETESEQFVLPGGISGTYYIGVLTDGADAVGESDETNNTAALSIDVAAPGALPDLFMGSAGYDNDPTSGAETSINFQVMNLGSGDAGASTTYFYLSDDDVIDATDTLLSTEATGALLAGESVFPSTQFVLPADVVGAHYIGIVVDGDDAILEADETNNITTLSIDVQPAPDLITYGLTVSDPTPTAGDTVTVNVTTENQGAGDASWSTTYYYLSDDAVIDATDTLLGTGVFGALAAGESDY